MAAAPRWQMARASDMAKPAIAASPMPGRERGRIDEQYETSGAARFEVWPHRALDRSQTLMVVTLVGAVMLSMAALPAIFGLWPVSLVVAGSFAAFAAFFLHNGKPQSLAETVEVTSDRVVVTYFTAHGACATEAFDPYWARVDLRSDHYVESRLTMRQSGKSVEIGRCLAPEERVTLAQALTGALARHRSGVRLDPQA